MKVNLEECLAGEVSCPPGRRRIEYTDSYTSRSVAGLFLEVRETSAGTGTWFLRFKRNGKTAYQRLGAWPEVSLYQARDTAQRLKTDINHGKLPTKEKKEENSKPTFRQFFFDCYIPAAKVRKRSWKRDEQIYRLRLTALADIPLDQLTRQQIANLHIGLKNRGYAPATCNHALKVIRQTLNLAVSYDVLSKNPAVGIQLIPEDNVVDRFLKPDELSRLLKVLKTDKNRNVCRIALWLLSTGCRYQEALQSQWSQLDLERRVWKIPSESTKTHRTRVIPLNDAAMEVIGELDTKDKYPYLFINPKTCKPYSNIHKVWERLRADAGLESCRLHDLRHAHASILANSGESLITIAKLLGHASVRTSERYSHISPKSLVEASNNAARVIKEAMQEAG